MSLYRVLVVDDEEDVRHGIIKKINWEENGFLVVGDAENGQDALEKAEKLQPDIVITDIAMPFMDGLELGKRLSVLMPSTKIIIFSGADDFEYAHKAIKINVIEYILKPVNSIELTESLKKVKKQLDNEYDEKRNVEILKKHYEESLPVIREQFLVGVLEGRISENQWNEEYRKLGLDFISKNISVALIHLDDISTLKEVNDNPLREETALITISIKKLVDDDLKNYCKFISFPYSDMVVIITSLEKKEDITYFIKGINEICMSFKRIMNISISAGIGHIYDDFKNIRFSYRTAKDALGYRLVLGTGKAIYIDDVEPDSSIHLEFEEEEERLILNAIKVSSKDEIAGIIDGIFKKIENSLLPVNEYRIYLIEVVISLLKLVQAYNLDVNEIFGENFNCYSYLETFNSLKEMKRWLIENTQKINVLIKKKRINSSKLLIEEARNYISLNYDDCELSVEKLCSKLHVSPTYFSTVFKKETGTSFVNYLTNIRLEEAIKLLNTTDDKTHVIATKVGYSQANYFSYVFKRNFGVSPSKYRKN
ncbi:response regulator [Clostridium chauvoei]|uniref:Stage 0 sporulation protein A homolog n=2 Tax=Clostridium chauvoei TaxID=46867 RepID=A0A1U6JER9_9CLOT|nr:response regulator [Clostridium chauvoei]ATD57076.1 DNA-binding response regulator [Clostridium chauvoei]MBX7279598.1 response regulator [Clostridium chauvoei]MBX7281967.1 response regulator [Clostridium chauvoei]MBX7284444.1 response regulator [Clostridium chauvoei]MBX7287011.1 response regulator [Clostridium chauvoei]